MVISKNIICSYEKSPKIIIGTIYEKRIKPFFEDFEKFYPGFVVIFWQTCDIFR